MEELLKREYGDFLTEDEIKGAMIFYRLTKDQIKTVIICDEMKKAFYGKTFGRKDETALNRINELFAVSCCLRLIGKKEKYFLDQPTDVQDEMLKAYDAGKADEDIREKLCVILNIDPATIPKEYKEVQFPKKETDNKTEEKESLLVQLKRFQAEINRKYLEKNKK